MIDIVRHKLSNGLRVVLNRRPNAGMATVNLLYRVGSKNEVEPFTGLAHLCEHLMFSGTLTYPDFDLELQKVGGRNNAWTNYDITNYYDTLPVEHLEIALRLEADRMQNLSLTRKAIDVQKSVVLEEFKQRCLNAPYGDVSHILLPLVYRIHPYRWPVLGKDVSHIKSVPDNVIRQFYNNYYSPDNAILSIVGNCDTAETISLIEKYFGEIPNRSERPMRCYVEPEQSTPRCIDVERNVPADMIVMAFRMCSRLDKQYAACDLISDILSNGRSSRLYQNILLNGNLVSSIDASISGTYDMGTLIVKARLLPGIKIETAEDAIRIELDKLKSETISDYELQKVVNRFEANDALSNTNSEERAANLAYFENLGNVELINTEVNKYRNVTISEIQNLSKRLFANNNSNILYYHAKSNT